MQTPGAPFLEVDAQGYPVGRKSYKTVSGSLAADGEVIAAVTGRRIKVIAYALFVTGTTLTVLSIRSGGAGGTIRWTVPLQAPAANSVFGANLAASIGFLFAGAAGEDLYFDMSVNTTVYYSLSYYDDDAT